MCGRFALKTPVATLGDHFELGEPPECELTPRYNISPGTDIATIRLSPEGRRVMHLLRWGLVPNWAKDPAIGNRLSNARGETVAEKPSFRSAFQRRRCLVPVDGYYEWKAEGRTKLPHYFSMRDGEPFALGGLWESWRTPDGSILRTVCLITTSPNEVAEPIHDRMPVIVGKEDFEAWLSGKPHEALSLVRPFPAEPMQEWQVDRRVSKASEEGEALICHV